MNEIEMSENGKPATRTIEVHVTQADIAAGEMLVCERCPVALAICRAMQVQPGDPNSGGISVGLDDIAMMEWNNELWSVSTPDLVSHFVFQFDIGHPVVPFSFTLTIPVV